MREYTLPRARYKELYYKVLQYRDWKEELEAITLIGSASNTDGQPHGTAISDPTASAAVKAEEIIRKIEAVEKCARIAGGQYMYGAILKGATTQGVNYTWLYMHGYLYMGRRQYDEARHYFYYLIDKEFV